MAETESVSDRIKEARFRTAARLRESVSGDRMAELVGEALGRVMHPTQWRRYESGEREPPLDVIRATARVSGLSEAYIAFGTQSEDIIDPRRDRKLSEEELDRADRADAKAKANTARGKASARSHGRRGQGPRGG